ncbi:MAG: Nif3-like dinuclear metal center hexameric protein [Chryseolinea sp.]
MNTSEQSRNYSKGRRDFLGNLTAAGLLLTSKLGPGENYFSVADEQTKMTIQQVIDVILKEIPGAPFAKTVDTIKSGDAGWVVTGIVTTMFATVDVIKKAASLGANFIIAHEPTFYGHTDATDWLDGDPVYKFKKDLLDKNKIVVWRFHDYWHTYLPDGVLMGVLTKLGWEKYYNAQDPEIVTLPGMKLGEIINLAKKNLNIRQVRFIGNKDEVCKRVALIPGAAGGTSQMTLLRQSKPDALIVGEVHEWETAEYVRDAQAMGTKMSLIVLGHAESEEPGMEWLAPWLTSRIKDVKVTHVPSHSPFNEA